MDEEMPTDEELWSIARKSAEDKAGFYIHFAVYVTVNIFIIALWWVTGGAYGIFPWFIFPLFGWGIGVAIHFVSVFRGKQYVAKMTEKEYQRLKKNQ
ncbi:MAG TPA: 2TM domain-containing protein [Methanomicrobiales archaeon]|nr:2TM domain-containing protein [Methanomicrobiales archaeon]